MNIDSDLSAQFIPLHYHHNMLMDESRMSSFKAAIESLVFPGAKVLDLGGGTGVMSWFASRLASKVWCVELDPVMVDEARRLLAINGHVGQIEVIHADALTYLPPEPVDVVICEMVHAALLQENLVEVIESFKRRYRRRFGGPLPVFMPEAVLMAVQPIQQDYCFHAFNAPIIQFQRTEVVQSGTSELAAPQLYATVDLTVENDLSIAWDGNLRIEKSGMLNALRFITKNILALHATLERSNKRTAIDWLNNYLVLPLSEPIAVEHGQVVGISFGYRFGGTIQSLLDSIDVRVELRA